MAGGFSLRLAVVASILAILAFAPLAAADSVENVHVDSGSVAPTNVAHVVADASIDEGKTSVDTTRCTSAPQMDVTKGSCEHAVQSSAPNAHVSYAAQVTLPLSLSPGASSSPSTGAGSSVATKSVAVVPIATAAQIATAATAVAGVAGIVYALQRFGRLAILGLLPLYSHIEDGDLLKEPNRAHIFDLIKAEPGISTKDIADRLNLAWGTVTHHLAKLEKRQFVVSKKYGKYRRYFANGAAADSAKKDLLAILKVPATAEVAHAIRDMPGLSQKEVSAQLGVSSSTVLWHVKRLERVSLVNRVRDGKAVRYYPSAPLVNEWAPVQDLVTAIGPA